MRIVRGKGVQYESGLKADKEYYCISVKMVKERRASEPVSQGGKL